MRLSRRQFVAAGAGLAAGSEFLGLAKGLGGLKIGVTDWNLKLSSKIEALELARRIGFEGVEVSLGSPAVEGKLILANAALQEQYLKEASRLNMAIAGTCCNILHKVPPKTDEDAKKFISDGIQITKNLKAGVMLCPFFGDNAPLTPGELDYMGDVFREVAPEAEKAGVVLGLENSCSARDNVRMMERSRSGAVKMYYDVGNSTSNGFDIFEEMRWLGPSRICQFHFKDNPHYLGEGTVDFPAVIRLIAEFDYHGFANLETTSPKSVEGDMRRNLAFIRRTIENAHSS